MALVFKRELLRADASIVCGPAGLNDGCESVYLLNIFSGLEREGAIYFAADNFDGSLMRFSKTDDWMRACEILSRQHCLATFALENKEAAEAMFRPIIKNRFFANCSS
jgi:hypothetical protein